MSTLITPQSKSIILMSLLSLIVLSTIAIMSFGADKLIVNQLLPLIDPQSFIHQLFLSLLLTLFIAIGLPRQVAALSLGYLLGTIIGTLTATLAACGGCLITFYSAQRLFNHRIQHKYPEQLNRLTHFFSHNTMQKAFIIRLIPVGSNFITNLLAGAAKAPALPYLLGTAIGFVPQMTLFAMLGAGVRVGQSEQIILSVVLITLAFILSYRLYRQSREKLPNLSI